MMPRNSAGVPIEPTDYNRSDGFSPGADDRAEGARASTRRRRSRGPARCRSPTSRARTTAAQPIVVINARTRQAPPDLGRARLERRHAGEHRAADPPGQELPRGRALHRRAAQAARRRRQAAATRRARSALYRDRVKTRLAAVRAPPLRTWRSIFCAAQAGGHRAPRPLPGVGLHRGERALAVAADAVDPRPRLRRARRHATCAT